jgi:hypothetical protein
MSSKLSHQNILFKLQDCKRYQTDFYLIFEYYNNQNNTMTTDKIECGWYWDATTNINNHFPNEISVYDKGWDQSIQINFKDIHDCIPVNTQTIERYNSEFNTLVDNIYSSFCNIWNNGEYEDAEIVMRHLHAIVKDRTNLITNNNSLFN